MARAGVAQVCNIRKHQLTGRGFCKLQKTSSDEPWICARLQISTDSETWACTFVHVWNFRQALLTVTDFVSCETYLRISKMSADRDWNCAAVHLCTTQNDGNKFSPSLRFSKAPCVRYYTRAGLQHSKGATASGLDSCKFAFCQTRQFCGPGFVHVSRTR